MKTIAADTETFLIERLRPFPTVVCLSWYDGNHSAVIPHGNALVDWVERVLLDTTIRLVGHNVAYDSGCLGASYPHLLPLIFDAYASLRITDTMIRQQLFDIAVGRIFDEEKVRYYSLRDLYKLIFDREPSSGPKFKITEDPTYLRFRYGNLYYVPFSQWDEESIDYSRADSVDTYDVWAEQDRKVGHLLRDDPFQAYSAFCLALITAQGMRTDAGCVRTLKAEQNEILEYLRQGLVDAGLLEPKYAGRGPSKHIVGWTKKRNVAQARVIAACEALGIKPLMTKPDNPKTAPSVAVDRAAVTWCEDPVMLSRAEYSTAEKILSTYVPTLEAGTVGPITSAFNLAATGRTTSSTPREPLVGNNQQNAPRKTKRVERGERIETDKGIEYAFRLVDSSLGVRECYVPRKGRIYLRGDLEGAELHGLAQVCKNRVGYSVLGDVLKSGRDAHLYMACYLLDGDGNDYDEILRLYKENDNRVGEARQESKPANFGFGGYMGVPTFILTQLKVGKKWSTDKATRVREAWFKAYPEMNEYFEINKIELGPGGQALVEFLWSRRLRLIRGLPMISNNLFQALVGDGAKKATNQVVRLCYVGGSSSALYTNGTKPVNFIHDELVTETIDRPYRELAPVVSEFKTTIENEFNEVVPDYPTTVECVLSYNLSKRAKPVYDDKGYLKPWLGLAA